MSNQNPCSLMRSVDTKTIQMQFESQTCAESILFARLASAYVLLFVTGLTMAIRHCLFLFMTNIKSAGHIGIPLLDSCSVQPAVLNQEILASLQ